MGATLRVWTDERGEELLPMEGACEGDHVHYSVSYTPAQTGVVWYSFDLAASDGAPGATAPARAGPPARETLPTATRPPSN